MAIRIFCCKYRHNFKTYKENDSITHLNCTLLCFIVPYFALLLYYELSVYFQLLNLIPMNPLRSTSRNSSISSDATVASVSRFIVMPEGIWNLSRMRRIISWFRVCQTMVRRIGSLFLIFGLLYGSEYLVCHLRHPCVA